MSIKKVYEVEVEYERADGWRDLYIVGASSSNEAKFKMLDKLGADKASVVSVRSIDISEPYLVREG